MANGFVSLLITGLLHHFLPVRNRFASHGKDSVKMHPKMMASLNLFDIPSLVRFALRAGLIPSES